MATAIYLGFAMHGLAVMLTGGMTKGKVTPGGAVFWTLAFDALCMAALIKYLVS